MTNILIVYTILFFLNYARNTCSLYHHLFDRFALPATMVALKALLEAIGRSDSEAAALRGGNRALAAAATDDGRGAAVLQMPCRCCLPGSISVRCRNHASLVSFMPPGDGAVTALMLACDKVRVQHPVLQYTRGARPPLSLRHSAACLLALRGA